MCACICVRVCVRARAGLANSFNRWSGNSRRSKGERGGGGVITISNKYSSKLYFFNNNKRDCSSMISAYKFIQQPIRNIFLILHTTRLFNCVCVILIIICF